MSLRIAFLFFLQFCGVTLGGFVFLLCPARVDRHVGFGSDVAILSLFRNVVEKGVELIKIALGNGIVFVVMTPRATDCESHPNSRGGLDPVGHILDEEFFRDDPALVVDSMIAIESCRKPLVVSWIRKQVARELLDRKLVERHVLIQGLDDPVAPRPLCFSNVALVATGIGIARRIEPGQCHALAIGRRSEESIDHFLASRRGCVSEEIVDFRRSGRQAGEVEGHAADPSLIRGGRRRRQVLSLKPSCDEGINIAPRPLLIFVG